MIFIDWTFRDSRRWRSSTFQVSKNRKYSDLVVNNSFDGVNFSTDPTLGVVNESSLWRVDHERKYFFGNELVNGFKLRIGQSRLAFTDVKDDWRRKTEQLSLAWPTYWHYRKVTTAYIYDST